MCKQVGMKNENVTCQKKKVILIRMTWKSDDKNGENSLDVKTEEEKEDDERKRTTENK